MLQPYKHPKIPLIIIASINKMLFADPNSFCKFCVCIGDVITNSNENTAIRINV